MTRIAAILALAASVATPFGLAAPGASDDGGLRAAVALVKSKGYTPDPGTWESAFPLNVLIGTLTRSADGYNQRAFFFYRGRFLGTDAREPSSSLRDIWQDDRTVALMYTLYRPADPLCCPTGGGKIVRFRWNGQRLVALDSIPTRNPQAPLHR